MITEIFLEGYTLDLTADISSLLTFAIDDVKDFSSRQTTFSKTIVLPGTANNNKVFGHIFQPGQSNAFDSSQNNVGYNFNAAKSADCIIFQDQLQTFKGVLRLLQINSMKGRIEYEVSVFGKLTGLNVALSGAFLEDLDFSAYDHVYNDANIVASWDNPGGTGVYYPLIDYGTYSTNKHDWDIRTFRPAVYAYELIDKMFAAAGFRWQSELFETPRFSSLVVPHNQKRLSKISTTLAGGSTNQSHNYLVIVEVGEPSNEYIYAQYDLFSATDFSLVGSTFVMYTGTDAKFVIVSATITGLATIVEGADEILVSLVKISGATETVLDTKQLTGVSDTYTFNGGSVSVANGDLLALKIYPTNFTPRLEYTVTLSSAQISINSQAPTVVNVNPGDIIAINDAIPKNIKQIDFLVGIVKMFNLYVYEDRLDTSLIYLKPYINFYQNAHNSAVDWTYKLNRNKVIKLKPMSELTAKVYKFKFKPDSDYYNELYRKRYNEGYGDRAYDSEFEFTEQIKEFEVIFSATPLIGYGGEDKVYPTIFKQSNGNEETVDSNIRLLQSKKITGVASWNIKDGTSTVLNTLTRYGYAGHFNDPNAPTDDLNFGVSRELFFTLVAGDLRNNQFNVYWSGYMAEITNKDSKLLSASFHLTPLDIMTLDFSKLVYIDGGLFRLNTIKDYNLSKPSDCVVELLKVNSVNYTEAASPESPPDGNFLLWSDDNTLDFDDSAGNELLYRSNDSVLMNWSYDHGAAPLGLIRITINASFPFLHSNSDGSGSITVVPGDVVKVDVQGAPSLTVNKELTIDSDIDGNLYTGAASTTNKTFTFTAQEGRVYTITGSTTP